VATTIQQVNDHRNRSGAEEPEQRLLVEGHREKSEMLKNGKAEILRGFSINS
jgi:hypothetical protein